MPLSVRNNFFKKKRNVPLDTNVIDATTAAFKIPEGAKTLSIFVTPLTGAHNNHIVTLQVTPESGGSPTWFTTPKTITGKGLINKYDIIAKQARLKVTTAEGSASTVDIDFFTT